MRIAVAGATGVVGHHVAEDLADRGHEAVLLSRSLGVDVTSPVGLAERLHGVDAVIDTLSVVTTRRAVAEDFFRRTTSNLIEAGREAGVRHHVTLSIVGIDGIAFGYYQGKVAQEEVVRASGQPFTILRATQFHEFAQQMVDRGTAGPVTVVPRMRSAPVSAREVATTLVEVATGAAHDGTLEMSGPCEELVADMVRRLLRVRGSRRRVLQLPLPTSAGRAMAGGALIAKDPWRVGTVDFDAWLAEAG